jgi:hypothetical protein
MKTNSTPRAAFFSSRLLIGFVVVSVGFLLALVGLGIFRNTQPLETTIPPLFTLVDRHYCVLPSETDGPNNDGSDLCHGKTGPGIGCDRDDEWGNENDNTDDGKNNGNNDGINIEHYLYLPPLLTDTGKLLVFLAGGNGSARGGGEGWCSASPLSMNIYPVAARQGYHVIGLTYPAAKANGPCDDYNLGPQQNRDCYGNAFREVVTGEDSSPSPGSEVSTVSKHRQDSIVNRLLSVLKWAHKTHPNDGWGRYLTASGGVNWSLVHLAGHSNGASHASYMGQLAQFQEIGRVALFAGPDDGNGGESEAEWNPATYIQEHGVPTADRYYGLVHKLNKAKTINGGKEVKPAPIYQVLKNWNIFGMEEPTNPHRYEFDPQPGETPYFGDAHILLSKDPERAKATDLPIGTTKWEAHGSVVNNVYCTKEGTKEKGNYDCLKYGTASIGYEPAQRCILGTGDRYASARPIANAGPDQTVECQGNGGANVALDGSGTRDYDCELLRYAWTVSVFVPLGMNFASQVVHVVKATGKNPTVFFPLGMNLASLVVQDDWWFSLPAVTRITVEDTRPPSLQVTLTPAHAEGDDRYPVRPHERSTVLWPPNHKLVRIDVTVKAVDSCGDGPVQVVLTSITSDQPDNGTGDGDAVNDIQDAQIGTLDQSFLLRAERADKDPNGRTYTIVYTATDASGNQTQANATVHVPHS